MTTRVWSYEYYRSRPELPHLFDKVTVGPEKYDDQEQTIRDLYEVAGERVGGTQFVCRVWTEAIH